MEVWTNHFSMEGNGTSCSLFSVPELYRGQRMLSRKSATKHLVVSMWRTIDKIALFSYLHLSAL